MKKKPVTLAVKHLDECIRLTNPKHDQFMHGFYNGLQMAKNALTGEAPDFHTQVGRYRNGKFKRGNK